MVPDPPLWLVITALLIVLGSAILAVRESARLVHGEDAGPMPWAGRVLVASCWLVVAADMVAHGWWGLALGPVVFAALALLAGWIHRRFISRDS